MHGDDFGNYDPDAARRDVVERLERKVETLENVVEGLVFLLQSMIAEPYKSVLMESIVTIRGGKLAKKFDVLDQQPRRPNTWV